VVDFLFPEKKLIVNFNGPLHYFTGPDYIQRPSLTHKLTPAGYKVYDICYKDMPSVFNFESHDAEREYLID
jgi:very-short-patch-repair endonuclease